MRQCKKCGIKKKYNEFKIEKNNLTGFSLTLCADCHRHIEKTKYRNKIKETIIAF
jgi:hypothetical protein